MSKILPISKIASDDKVLVGVKASSLAYLMNHNVPVPDGFVVTTELFEDFLIRHKLKAKIEKELEFLDQDDPESYEIVSGRLREMIKKTPLDKETSDCIFDGYERLGSGEPFVSIRTSPIKDNYKAGFYPLFLNVKGEMVVADLVKEIWMSQYSVDFLKEGKNLSGANLAVVVQRMIEAQASGFVHTVNRGSRDKTMFEIEAIWGIGELLAQSKVRPDIYFVNKESGKVINKIDRDQGSYLTIKDDEVVEKKLSKKQLEQEILTEKQILNLMEVVKRVDKASFYPQSLEWVMYHDQVYILQTQDLIADDELVIENEKPDSFILNLEILAKGRGIAAGVVTGKIEKIKGLSDVKKLGKDEIGVMEEINSEMFGVMKKIKGLVVAKNQIGTDVALAAAEYGIPVIVGVENIMSLTKKGEFITIDGSNGYVYGGELDLRGKGIGFSRQEFKIEEQERREIIVGEKIRTKANVYVNLPYGVNSSLFKNLDINGVCYVRGENLIAKLGIHPKKTLYKDKGKMLKKVIKENLSRICREFEGEVFYRISDFQNTAFARLRYGSDFEVEEENKMIGFRGGLRHLLDDRLLVAELEMAAKVFEKNKNLRLILPFIRTISEFEIMKRVIIQTGYLGEIWLWAGSPSNLILLPEFIKRGIDGFMIDLEHLASLIVGVDPMNIEVNRVFSEMDSSVLWLVERANVYANEKNVPCIISTKYAGIYGEFVSRMINVGVDGFSVPFDQVSNARRLIKKAEIGIRN